ncbi:MAG: hypothetical protein WEH44_01935, partial [Pirellulaceae bacterium]
GGGKFLRRLILLCLLLAVLIGFLPAIIASTSLRNILANRAIPGGAATVSVGSASLGWFGDQTLTNVELRDAGGKALATIESVRVDRSLIAIASNWHDLGTVEVLRPTIYLELRPEGNNWDALLQQFMPPARGKGKGAKAAPTTAGFDIALQIREGRVEAVETASNQSWLVAPLNVEFAMANSDLSQLRMVVEGELQAKTKADDPWGNSAPAGPAVRNQFAVRLEQSEGENHRLEFKLAGFPLELAGPWLHAAWPTAEMAGLLAAEGTAQWPSSAPLSSLPPRLETQGRVEVRNFIGTLPALQGDRIRLDRLELPWQLSLDDDALVVKQLELRSEVMALVARGKLDRRALDRPALAAAAGIAGVDVGATLDMARLGAMLPRTLRLRENTQINSGTVELTARTKS